jgi:hypothetical protein
MHNSGNYVIIVKLSFRDKGMLLTQVKDVKSDPWNNTNRNAKYEP